MTMKLHVLRCYVEIDREMLICKHYLFFQVCWSLWEIGWSGSSSFQLHVHLIIPGSWQSIWNSEAWLLDQKHLEWYSVRLNAHVRDKPLNGTLTSGLCWPPWLIPHNVLLNAQTAGSTDKRTRPWSNHGVSMVPSPDPIWPRDRIAILIGAWGLAVQRWVWTNEKPYFSYAEVSALFTYWHGEMGEFTRNQILLRKSARLLPMP